MDTISELDRDQRAERAIIREDAELLGELMKHKGWLRYVTLIETIGQNYHASIMKPLESVLEATKPEFAKGVLTGLTLATAVPGLKIREAHELRRTSEDE